MTTLTIFLPTPFGGVTIKNVDTPLTHAQKQFIFSLEHGANKGRFTETVKEIKFNWSRGWWHCPPYNLSETLRAKFDKVNN